MYPQHSTVNPVYFSNEWYQASNTKVIDLSTVFEFIDIADCGAVTCEFVDYSSGACQGSYTPDPTIVDWEF